MFNGNLKVKICPIMWKSSGPHVALRQEGSPVEDVSPESLEKKGLIELLPPLEVERKEDVKNIPEDVDAILVGSDRAYYTKEEILDEIASLNKPLIADWDNWGYSIYYGRVSKFRFNKYSNVKYFIPTGAKEISSLLKALRSWKILRNLKVLYIGEYPSSTVSMPESVTFDYVRKKIGVEILHLDHAQYLEAIKNVKNEEAEKIASKWSENFEILDNREQRLGEYGKIYLAIRNLIEKYNVDAITIDCLALPGEREYQPCLVFSILIDEGIPCGCEGDLPALFTLTMLMGISGKGGLMGNLNVNVTHMEIENNVITINHDIVPPSYACPGCKFRIRDFHGSGKGTTPYTVLLEDADVTLAGMSWDMDNLWTTRGKVLWTRDGTEDTGACRVCIGVKVKDAKKIVQEALGHHQVLVYGDYTEELEKVAKLMDLNFSNFE